MIYQGSKSKLRNDILPILQNCIDTHKVKGYVEPFVGGGKHYRSYSECCTDRNGQ